MELELTYISIYDTALMPVCLQPLVSVIIPTSNSQPIVNACMRAVNNQTYKDIEMIVVDSQSADDTVKVASNLGASVIETEWKSLGAILEGVKTSKGEYILLLDYNQILFAETVERLVMEVRNHDMLYLEEKPYTTGSLIDKLFVADSKLLSEHAASHLNPMIGPLFPRFYKRSIIEAAIANIDTDSMHAVLAHDLEILFYEAYRISQNVGIVPKAAMRKDNSTFRELWRENYTLGQSAKLMMQSRIYPELLSKRMRFRNDMSLNSDSIKSILLLVMKGLPYTLGMLNVRAATTPRKSRHSMQPDLWYSYS